jgi:serralysin
MIGGTGSDTFVYTSANESGITTLTRDVIADFRTGDLVDLRLVDANSNVSGNQDFAFLGTGSFTGVAGQLRVNVTNPLLTILEADRNGDGTRDFQIGFLGNQNVNNLNAANILGDVP